MKKSVALGLLIFGFSQLASAFSHENWELQCTNTGTCKAAGYANDYEDDYATNISILLTRKAGAQQPVTGQFQFAFDEDDSNTSEVNEYSNIHFFINNQDLGAVKINSEGAGNLSQKQVNALLATVKQPAQILFKNNHSAWKVSDKGLTAVLLKMDEFQQRLGTLGALVEKGAQDEQQVRQATPRLKVKAEKITLYKTLVATDIDYQKINALFTDEQDDNQDLSLCYSNNNQPVACPITLYQLSNGKLLATQMAWRGAYNEGMNVLLLDQALTDKGILVSDSINNIDHVALYSGHRGRGVGDCWSYAKWVWDGQAIVAVSAGHTGMCKGFLGGFWPTQLDSIEADVENLTE